MLYAITNSLTFEVLTYLQYVPVNRLLCLTPYNIRHLKRYKPGRNNMHMGEKCCNVLLDISRISRILTYCVDTPISPRISKDLVIFIITLGNQK